jgi:hypothetical protein
MPIGYANFGTIEQANNQTVNQLAGLGQQIGNAIETHAATQSAQAMLPMLQQQYQTGMAKIAGGDPNGLGDVYSASVIASQNPLLAPMANHAVNMAQSANINAQHMMRTQAMIQGRNLGLAAKYPGFMDLQTGQINPNYTPSQKGLTPYQQTEAQVNQAKSYSSLYQGKPDTSKGPGEPGIGPLADKINTAISNGENPDPADIKNFASKIVQYKQLQNAYGQNATPHPEIENAFSQIQKQIPNIQGLVKKEEDKGAGGWFGIGHADKSKIQSLNQGIEQLQGLGGLPSAQGGTVKGTATQDLMQAVQVAKLHPDKIDEIKRRLQKANIDPSLLDQSLNPQQTQSAPQSSTMIPAASQNQSQEEQESTEGETE